MLRVLISALLVVVAISALRVRPAGHGADSPKFVAPDVPDLTIKTRRTIDHPNSTIETELLNLKGAWQRRTQILDFPPTIPSVRTRRHVAITRCDERRAIDLNEEARTYASVPLADMAEHARRFRLTTPRRPAVLTPADVQIVIDSVDNRRAAPDRPLHRAPCDHDDDDRAQLWGEDSCEQSRRGWLVHRRAAGELLGLEGPALKRVPLGGACTR